MRRPEEETEEKEMIPIYLRETVDTYCYTRNPKGCVARVWDSHSTDRYRAALVIADTRHAIMSQRGKPALLNDMSLRL